MIGKRRRLLQIGHPGAVVMSYPTNTVQRGILTHLR